MMFMVAAAVSAALLILVAASPSYASSTSGSVKQVVENEKMQIYVSDVKEEHLRGGKLLYLDVVLKNLEPAARVFNPFFVKVIDIDESEHRTSPLQGTIMPIRIPSNDILAGRLTFELPSDAVPSMLVWEEFDSSKLVVDLTQSKNPPDSAPGSDWVLSSNKGRVLSDGRAELTIHDELLNKSPAYYLIDISIKNLSSAPIEYSVVYAFAKDQRGLLYFADLQNFDLMRNPLRAGELEPGEEVRGEVLFLLPDTVSAVMFIYDEKLGLGSYFVAPEFPYHAAVLIASLGTGLVLARLAMLRKRGLSLIDSLID